MQIDRTQRDLLIAFLHAGRAGTGHSAVQRTAEEVDEEIAQINAMLDELEQPSGSLVWP
jgi:copper oxidase (laccase) domain-containing protein